MSDEQRPTRITEPNDRLSRLAAAMTDALEAHPEYGGERAIVMLDSQVERRYMTHLSGYDDETEAVVDLFLHLRAMMRATGRDLDLIGIPNDASGLT